MREDGFEYWELVKEIDYTYWATIEHDEWWEVNDLVGPKREELDQEVGSAPGSWDVGDAAEVVTNPLLYPGGLPDGQFPVGWGGQEVTTPTLTVQAVGGMFVGLALFAPAEVTRADVIGLNTVRGGPGAPSHGHTTCA